jgi:endonuclease YncB( thermonuclease family)
MFAKRRLRHAARGPLSPHADARKIIRIKSARMIASRLICSLSLAGLCLAAAIPQTAAQPAIVGKAEVIEGDLIVVNGVKVRLKGIDAPEEVQTCYEGNGRPYQCGLSAQNALKSEIGEAHVSCSPDGVNERGTIIAICYLGSRDLAEIMVRNGYVVVRGDERYADAQQEAKRARRGLWSGPFETPLQWRQKHGFSQ